MMDLYVRDSLTNELRGLRHDCLRLLEWIQEKVSLPNEPDEGYQSGCGFILVLSEECSGGSK